MYIEHVRRFRESYSKKVLTHITCRDTTVEEDCMQDPSSGENQFRHGKKPRQQHSPSQPPTMQGEETNDVCATRYIKVHARNLDLR